MDIGNFSADVMVEGDRSLVIFRGDVDGAREAGARNALSFAMVCGHSVVVDCQHVTSMDSTGLWAFVEANLKLGADGYGGMKLRRPSAPVRRAIEVAGVGSYFSIER